MPLWTISSQTGTDGATIGAELAVRAQVPLVDRETLATLASALEPSLASSDLDDLEERVGGRLAALALSAAITSGAPAAFQELQLRQTLPTLGRVVLHRAARGSAVVVANAAFAALAEHPGALHVRFRAPFAWRVEEVRRRDLLDAERAKRVVRHDDQLQRNWVRALYHADVDNPAGFALVIDVSRLSRDRIVEMLLAAGGRT